MREGAAKGRREKGSGADCDARVMRFPFRDLTPDDWIAVLDFEFGSTEAGSPLPFKGLNF